MALNESLSTATADNFVSTISSGRAKFGYGLGNQDGEAFWLLGMLQTIRIGREDTGGQYGLLEIVVPQGVGSPWHVHPEEDEWFYVLDGELTVYVGDARLSLTAGSFGFGPKGVPHTFMAESARWSEISGRSSTDAVRGFLAGGRRAGPRTRGASTNGRASGHGTAHSHRGPQRVRNSRTAWSASRAIARERVSRSRSAPTRTGGRLRPRSRCPVRIGLHWQHRRLHPAERRRAAVVPGPCLPGTRQRRRLRNQPRSQAGWPEAERAGQHRCGRTVIPPCPSVTMACSTRSDNAAIKVRGSSGRESAMAHSDALGAAAHGCASTANLSASPAASTSTLMPRCCIRRTSSA